jgi:serine/threonine protein kinase
LIGWYSDEQAIFIAMEYAQQGDLNDCVKEPLPEPEAKVIAQQIVEALEILHQRRWAHRDLKPSVSSAVISCSGANLEQNVFVIQKGPSWWVKLGDFGVSKSLANDMTQLRTNIDTDFTAPEIIGFPGAGSAEASSYTNAADLWSLGFLVHWLLTVKLPLTRTEMGKFCIGALPSLPQQHLREKYITNDGINFILSLLRPQPSQRPSAYHIREHKWLQEGITQTLPMPSHSIPEQHTRFAPQIPAINHAAVNMGHFAQFSPTSSTPTRTPPYPSSYVPHKYPYRDFNTSYSQPSRPPDQAPHYTLDFDTTNHLSSGKLLHTPPLTNSLSSGKSFHTPLGSRENAKPLQKFQLPRRSKTIRIIDPITKEEWQPSQLVSPAPHSAATPNLDADTPQEGLHSPASTNLPVLENSYDFHAFKADLERRKAERSRYERLGTAAHKAYLKQQADETERWIEASRQKLAASPSLSREKAAIPQAIGATTNIVPLTGLENADDTINQFKVFVQLERQKYQNKRDAQQALDRTKRLTELQQFAKSFKLNTPVPNDLIGILSKDLDKQAQIIDRARREAEEENLVTARLNPIWDKMADTEAVKALPDHDQIEESRYASTNQQVSAPDTIRERPVVRMPLVDQSNSKHEINHGQMLHENHLFSLRTQTLEALTANGQDLATDQPKSASKLPEHRPKTWAQLLADHGKQAPMTDQRNRISEPRKEAPSVDGAEIVSIPYIDQKPKPRRRKKKGNKKA